MASGALIVVAAGVTVALTSAGTSQPRSAHKPPPAPPASTLTAPASQTTATTATSTVAPSPQPTRVATRVLRLVDPTRTIHTATGQTVPRTVVTIVRYPVTGPSGATGADGQRTHGALPLIVFGHGFAVTPAPYARLLDAWTQAGYVVAAPVFPLENARAPGGPNERDLVNQPADMSLVITSLLAASRAPQGPLHGLIDPRHLAVAGQSDGGDDRAGGGV